MSNLFDNYDFFYSHVRASIYAASFVRQYHDFYNEHKRHPTKDEVAQFDDLACQVQKASEGK